MESLLQKLSGHLVVCFFAPLWWEKGENKFVRGSSLPFDFLSPGRRELVVLRRDRFMDVFLHLDHPRWQVRGTHQVWADLYLSPPFRSCDLSASIDPSLGLQTGRPAAGWVGMHSDADASAVRFIWTSGRMERKSIKMAAVFFFYVFQHILRPVLTSLKAPSQGAPTSW